jgi:hypothetical protein
MMPDVGSGAVNLSDLLNEIEPPKLVVPELDVLPRSSKPQKDLFAEKSFAAWKQDTPEARCDFASGKMHILNRDGIFVITLWKKSLYGRTLTDIKGDESMVEFFATNIAPLIAKTFGQFLSPEDWCIVTTPKRRHKIKNFASLISERIAERLGIPFIEDVAECHSKHRVNAVFSLNVLPRQRNIIVFDDFITTGQTIHSMFNLLSQYEKTIVFFAGINNHV